METKDLFQTVIPRYSELKGQVAIITGATRGIGKGIAIRLGKEGMRLVMTGLTPETLEKTSAELGELGVEAIAVPGNIGLRHDIDHLFAETMRVYGTVDLVVNNAANLHRVLFFDVTEEMFASEMDTNVKGPFLLSYKAAQVMKDKGRGCIIHISSVGGLRAHLPGLPYDATKGALDAMTRVMGIELAQFGIRVNGIAPGAIYTEHRLPLDSPRMVDVASRIPLNRFGLPLEIGAAVAFLASDEAAYIIGQTIYVDGGITAQLHPPKYPI